MLYALNTGGIALFSGCSGQEEATTTTQTSTAVSTETPTETQTETTSADSQCPEITSHNASYIDANTVMVSLRGTDNIGINRGVIQSSTDSVVKKGEGATEIYLEGELDGTLREDIEFLIEDTNGNKARQTRRVCYDARLGAELVKDRQPYGLGLDEPEVVEQSDQYYLFYRIGGGGDEIALAVSDDGKNWSKRGTVVEQGDSGSWDNNYVISPSHLERDGTHYLFYEGNDGEVSRLGWAKADDLEGPYEKASANPVLEPEQAGGFEDVLVGTPAVVEGPDGAIDLYYHGWDAKHDRVAVARSNDLETWEKASGNPIIDVESNSWYSYKVAPSDVRHWRGEYYVFIEGDDGEHWRTGLAVTEDPFEDISLVDYNPILGLGATGEFDDTHVHTPAGLLTETEEGEEFWLYYQGNDGEAYRLGRAVQPICS